MKKYSSCKPIPLEWMGEIPLHWIFTKNRYGFCKWGNGSNESEDTNVLSLTIKGIKIKTNLSFGKSTESYIGHQLVEKGAIVFTPRDFDQTPILSDVSKYDGCISNLYIVDKTKNGVLNHYVNYYWYGLKYSVNYFKNFSHGMRFSFNRFQFDEIPLLVPPIHEQTQIVSFLDTKTQKIDELIEKTEKKIELLKEKRTSLINHCVTKGLNSKVEMKDSGVEWIGDIPSHWIVSKFKYLSEIVTGNTPSKTDEDLYYSDSQDGFLWVKPTSLNKGLNYVNESEEHLTEEGKNQTRLIPKDSTMICCIGNTIRKHSISGQELSTNQQINSVIPNQQKLHPWFCLFYVNVFTRDLLKWSNFVTLPIYTKSDLEDTLFILPPIEEQNEIVKKIKNENKLFDVTIEKETQRIELLKEYRQSIISEVVTGKIDVRDEVAV